MQVVEVVGDAAGHPAQALQPLGVAPGYFLGPAALFGLMALGRLDRLGDVADDADEAGRKPVMATHLPQPDVDPATGAVRTADPVLALAVAAPAGRCGQVTPGLITGLPRLIHLRADSGLPARTEKLALVDARQVAAELPRPSATAGELTSSYGIVPVGTNAS